MQNLGGQTECIMGNWKIENARDLPQAKLDSQMNVSFFLK